MASRIRFSNSQVASALGTATFTLEGPPTNYVYTGSLSIPGSPSTGGFTVTIGGITWGTWAGNATFGPVQQYASEPITVVATGLTAGTPYQLILIGMGEREDRSPIIWPSAIATSVSTTNVAVASFKGAKIAATANTVIGTGVDAAIALAGTITDSGGFAGVTPNAIVVPATLAGTYLIEWHADWVNGTPISGALYFYFTISGTINRSADANLPAGLMTASARQSWGMSTIVPLAVGATILLRCFNSTGVNVTCEGAADDTGFRSTLSVALVGV